MTKKQALEKKNMAVIEKVYQRLREDKEVQGRIRVRVVEGDE